MTSSNYSSSSNPQVIPQKRASTSSDHPQHLAPPPPQPSSSSTSTYHQPHSNQQSHSQHHYSHHSVRPDGLNHPTLPSINHGHPLHLPAQYDPRATIVLIGMRGVGKVSSRCKLDLSETFRSSSDGMRV